MAHAEGSITIDRPDKVVFDFLLDGLNNPLWRPAVTRIERVPGKPAGVGAVFKETVKGPFGRGIAGDYEIVECVPNEVIKFQVIAGPARPTGTFKLESIGEATRLTFIFHYEPRGLAKLMDPMIASTMRGEIAMLSNLKTYLESHGG